MDQSEREIDELLTSLIVDVDEWEGGLLCTPENRKIVGEWLTKQRLTKRAPDVCPADGGKHSWHPNEDNYLIYSCRKCGARG